MFANATSLSVNPMFLRHHLLIELGRLEIAIRDARAGQPANDGDDVATLQTRQETLQRTLSVLGD
jgi:hypothetical protein